jgi:hypothetical protein
VASTGNSQKVPPDPRELEVSIFGPGFGECVVLHLGQGHWGVVDSCLNPSSKQPAAVDYFQSLGLDFEGSLRFIVATHWHDDHMQGLGSLFQRARNAVFACTAAVRERDFREVLGAWTGTRYLAGGSGLDELWSVLTELRKRQAATRYPAPRLASANKVLWELGGNPSGTVKALSPSDAAVLATMARLQTATPRFSRVRKRLPNPKENDASVVLSVQVGEHHVLLGADLQVRSDRGFGWMAVVDGVASAAAGHQGYKVPHHGSANADHDEIWTRLLIPQPWAATTPFVSGRVRLPSARDCNRILSRTRACYLTAPPVPLKFRDPNRTVEKAVSEATLAAHFVPGKYGHVRLRKGIDEPVSATWRVEMFGHALRLGDYVTAAQSGIP